MLHIILGLVLSVLCLTNAASVEPKDRIVQGTNANIQEVPYQCSLAEKGKHVCGCSILSKTHILTAAHCLDDNPDKKDLSVRVGSANHDSDGVVKGIKAYKIHPMYNGDTMEYDAGVLSLASDLVFSNKIKSIVMSDEPPKDGTECLVSGWGLLKNNGNDLSPTLKMAEVKAMTRETCEKTSYGKNIKDSMFCADGDGKDACEGDSGGPIVDVANNKLIGVISYGIECGSKKYPGVYASITKLRKFIDTTMKTL